MKIRRIKYIMFNYVIAILEFINEFYLSHLITDWFYKIYPGIDMSTRYSASAYMRHSILFILLIFIAYSGKFIIFRKKDRKGNLISVAKILISCIWLCFMQGFSMAAWFVSMTEEDAFQDINIRFMIVSCIICVVYIIFGERIHKKIGRKRV